MKVTPQRRAVFDALHGDECHPTADVIFDRVRTTMPTVSLRTVYQALNDLVELGEVQAVSVGAGASLFDPNVSSHDHFVCRQCDRVYDVMASRPQLAEGAEAAGHTVDAAEIVFRGLCASCAGHVPPSRPQSISNNPSHRSKE